MIYLCLAHMSEDGMEQKYVKEAFDTNWVVPMGPNVNAFEKELERFVASPKASPQPSPEGKGEGGCSQLLAEGKGEGGCSQPLAVGKGACPRVVCLSAGTAAVHLALLACGVGQGDEVIVQSFTFCASSHPITYLGATPVFVDSEPVTWNMDPVLLEKVIIDRKKRTGKYPKAIVPVALYGMPYQIDRIMAIADKYGIPVVEDAAEGMGSRFNGQVLGTFGRFGVLSFNGNKMITTSGGGALICNGKAFPQPIPERRGEGDYPKDYQKGKDLGIHTADPMWYDILKRYADENRKNPTEAEAVLWDVLKGNGLDVKFRRQHIIEDFIVDFYCNEKKLTIELDGGYHNVPEQMKSDAERSARLKELGYTEIRFTNEQVLCDFDSTIAEIERVCKSLPSGGDLEEASAEQDAQTIMWYATQARDAYPYYEHTAIGYNYRMSNVCAGIGRGQMTVLNEHIAHHKHVQELYRELLKDVKGVTLHEQPANPPSFQGRDGERLFDSNFWLCAATLDPEVRIVGQEDAYKEVIKTAVGGAAGVIKAVDSATTDCQPNENVEALRVFMLNKKVECRPVWKPMHKQPVYAGGASPKCSPDGKDFVCYEGPNMVAYVNGVSESIFKVGFCLPAGPYVSDDDVRYIVDCIKEAIV